MLDRSVFHISRTLHYACIFSFLQRPRERQRSSQLVFIYLSSLIFMSPLIIHDLDTLSSIFYISLILAFRPLIASTFNKSSNSAPADHSSKSSIRSLACALQVHWRWNFTFCPISNQSRQAWTSRTQSRTKACSTPKCLQCQDCYHCEGDSPAITATGVFAM